MKTSTTLPTLSQSICWTTAFYVFFGLFISVLIWFIGTASSNILFHLVGLNPPGWATGWLLMLLSIPLFGFAGAISGIIVYWPIKTLVGYLKGPGKAIS